MAGKPAWRLSSGQEKAPSLSLSFLPETLMGRDAEAVEVGYD